VVSEASAPVAAAQVDAVVETAEGHPSVYALHYQTSGDGETLAEPAMHTCRTDRSLHPAAASGRASRAGRRKDSMASAKKACRADRGVDPAAPPERARGADGREDPATPAGRARRRAEKREDRAGRRRKWASVAVSVAEEEARSESPEDPAAAARRARRDERRRLAGSAGMRT